VPNAGYTFRDRVGPGDQGRNALEFYLRHHPGPGPEEWRRRLAVGLVFRDGVQLRGDEPLAAGDRLEYRRPPWEEPRVPLDAPVLYADGSLVVFHKPAGLPMTPGAGCLEHTLLFQARIAWGPGLRPVHRLDTGTSGAVAFARDAATARRLHAAFLRQEVRKVYRGRVMGTELPDRFVVDLPMGPVPYPPLGFVSGVVAEGGRPAVTEGEVVRREPGTGESLVELRPRTGRSQQLRVHLAWSGWPLAGDRLYGPGGLRWPLPPGEVPSRPGDGGFRLHAWRLVLPGGDGRVVAVEAPLPEDLL